MNNLQPFFRGYIYIYIYIYIAISIGFSSLCDAVSGLLCNVLLVILSLYNLASVSAVLLSIKSPVASSVFRIRELSHIT